MKWTSLCKQSDGETRRFHANEETLPQIEFMTCRYEGMH